MVWNYLEISMKSSSGNLPRVIPVLLLKESALYKTVKFADSKYVGDPINAVRIFNEKEVDELVILDINASKDKKGPDYDLLESIVSEAFMPIGYGGGVNSLLQAKRLFNLGIEKIIINSALYQNESLLYDLVANFGSQSVVACLDYKKNIFGKKFPVFLNATKNKKVDLITFAIHLESLGVGEIILHSVDRDGTFTGYDLEQIKAVSYAINIPLVACGGAGKISDLADAIRAGASAVAAGSIFVFNGIHKAVLISYNNKI
jgi:cyclase